jgi:hypothetical protein
MVTAKHKPKECCMNLSDLKTSKYLKKEDVGRGVLVTIASLSRENVAMEGAEPEYKVAVHFQELDKPMVLNSTNGQLIAQIAGATENIDQAWIGKKIVLYNDPNIAYQGRLVGGIRVRAPKPGSVQDAPPVQEENLPF